MLGPFCRPLLEEARIPENYLDGLAAGTHDWDIKPDPAVGVSHDLEVARAIVREKAERAAFVVEIRPVAPTPEEDEDDPDERWVYKAGIPNALGQRIADARRYEEALAVRGAADATAFSRGTLEDWISATSTSWGAMAFEFRRAAEAVAAVHQPTAPAPLMALLTLCRHHLELALKSAIDAAGSVPTHHHLGPLWQQAQPIMRDAAAEFWDEDEATRFAEVLGEFEQIDSNGQAGRYPTRTDGTPFQRPEMLFAVSLVGFMDEFARAADFLSLNLLWIEVRRRAR